ncbi:hypothetical protein IEU95_15830 [Hoyosella rhizosphaerae]|uniref:Uncharacterized protein n=1 Tax=Hoyosella rhizosphaerae TaxID=1755582 RepID=A0A916UIS6_9ACTN|nr:hypothetical protein [Hoyosella rhizosphaerae]MBN4928305.1 hypothetical protein [Hoyosella rhizosphaerae]GGC73940.1 hypothetical protein GCM10011410_28920 [Hoyosella rhizosphaerae]
MSDRFNALEHWAGLGHEVEAGQVWVDPVKAREPLEACNRFIEGLEAMLAKIYSHGEVVGFGILPSGVHTRDVFAARLNESSQSLKTAIEQHIDVVERMRSVFKNSVDRFEEAEAATRANLNAVSQTR